MINLHHASCLDWLADYDGPLFDSCVTDPPYHLSSIVKRFGGENAAEAKVGATGAYARASRGFMGKEWDGGDIAFRPETWRAIYDAMKPGAHLVAFSGTRTYHRMVCAIEDAGFEIRDQLAWTYGSGFPKSHDISKAIDKAAGAERGKILIPTKVGNRPEQAGAISLGGSGMTDVSSPTTPEAQQWQGWGTALKPAWEPICLARKPISEKNIAANVLKYGTGAVNVDGCRVSSSDNPTMWDKPRGGIWSESDELQGVVGSSEQAKGRFPANLIHDGSDEVLAGFPETGAAGNLSGTEPSVPMGGSVFGNGMGRRAAPSRGDSGSAARFFYSAKAGPLDRIGSAHATVKPVDLMRWLVRLITPPDGHILEPFAGSGTTGIAAMAEGFDCTMIELEADHVTDIQRKLDYLQGKGGLSAIEKHKARIDRQTEPDNGPLFAA